MNLDELGRKLLAAARWASPDDRVPYAFEKRILALVRAVPRADAWAAWARALWFSAVVCTVVALLVGLWSANSVQDPEAGVSFSQDLEQSILAAVDDGESTW